RGNSAFSTDGNERNGDSVSSVTLASDGAAGTASYVAPGPDYAVTASNAVGVGLGNYHITYVNGNLHISQRDLTVTATNRSKTYGDVLNLGNSAFSTDGNERNGDQVNSVSLASDGAAGTASYVAPGPDYAVTAS